MTIFYFSTDRNTKIAYVHSTASCEGASLPAVMFLGGFKSDMAGTKAVYLEQQCKIRGQEFTRFDYTGHGESEGAFVEGTIGSWKKDALDILDHIVTRNVILVGSSMGGWIALLLLLEREDRVKGVVGIAAAPDFTKDIEAQMEQEERDMVESLGRLEVSNDYSDEPYIFTKDLLDDGRKQSVLNNTYNISVPLILIQGKKDTDVPWKKAVKIRESFQGPKTDTIFIEDGDHRLSREQDLSLIDEQIRKLSGL